MEEAKIQKRKKLTEEEKFQVYDLAKEGYRSERIFKVLGLKGVNKQAIKEQIINIIKIANKNKQAVLDPKNTLVDHVIGNLSEKQTDLFKELKDNATGANGRIGSVEAIEFLLQGQTKVARQKLFLRALIDNCFNIHLAKKMLNLSSSQLAIWKKDPEFLKMISELDLYKKNFFESKLIRLVEQGDSAATIFANKTYNRDLGYGDRVDVKHSHEHKHVTIDNLNISLQTKKELLAAIQEKKNPPALKAAPEDVIEGEIDDGTASS